VIKGDNIHILSLLHFRTTWVHPRFLVGLWSSQNILQHDGCHWLVEQEPITIPASLSSSRILMGVRSAQSLVFVYYFVDGCLSFCLFCFGHCVVCPSIYSFWLPPFVIFKLFLELRLAGMVIGSCSTSQWHPSCCNIFWLDHYSNFIANVVDFHRLDNMYVLYVHQIHVVKGDTSAKWSREITYTYCHCYTSGPPEFILGF
jgi:hypothetical protein